MSAFDDEFGLFGDGPGEGERRSTLKGRKLTASRAASSDDAATTPKPRGRRPRAATATAPAAPVAEEAAPLKKRASKKASAPVRNAEENGHAGGYDAPRGGYDAPRSHDAPRGGGYDTPRGGYDAPARANEPERNYDVETRNLDESNRGPDEGRRDNGRRNGGGYGGGGGRPGGRHGGGGRHNGGRPGGGFGNRNNQGNRNGEWQERPRTQRPPIDPVVGARRASEVLDFLAKRLVSKPDAVIVDLFADEDDRPVIELIVDPDDIGKVIGRNGRVAHALRTIVRATAEGRISVDILDTEEAAEDPEGEEE